MQDTAFQAGPPVVTPPSDNGTSASVATKAAPSIKKAKPSWPYQVLSFCASLRVTVVLFVLGFLLVLYGTLAQKDAGIWTVVSHYFRGWYAIIPWKIVFLNTINVSDNHGLLYPGGTTLGFLLLGNLLAAHFMRFKLSWKRSGILVLHFGLILMMLGEFFTGAFAVEGRMTIMESYRSDFVESDRNYELALVDRSDPKIDDEIRVPGSLLKSGAVLKNAQLPCDIEVVTYMVNSTIRRPREGQNNPATDGRGLMRVAVPQSETVGVDPNQSVEFPSAYVTLKDKKTGASLGTFLVSTWFSFLNCQPDTVFIDGKQYQITLRPKRSYRDYAVQLDKFDHKKFVGTEVAKDFRSFVQLEDPERKENRQVQIYMNHPLFYHDETFYQSALHPLTKGTILQVVHNGTWFLPYVAFVLVALGMLVHFTILLVNFLSKQGVFKGAGKNGRKKASPSLSR